MGRGSTHEKKTIKNKGRGEKKSEKRGEGTRESRQNPSMPPKRKSRDPGEEPKEK